MVGVGTQGFPLASVRNVFILWCWDLYRVKGEGVGDRGWLILGNLI